MIFVLTCALCAIEPATATTSPTPSGRQTLALLDTALEPPSAAPASLDDVPSPRLAAYPDARPGYGYGHDHGDRMTAMWLVVGVVLAVMVVVMVSYSNHGMWYAHAHSAAVASPAQLAVPVSSAGTPGG